MKLNSELKPKLKVRKLSDKILVYCVKEYYETGFRFFTSEQIVSVFPNENRFLVLDSIRQLGKNGFLNILYAENEPTNFELLLDAVQFVDKNTLPKKIYRFAKELTFSY